MVTLTHVAVSLTPGNTPSKQTLKAIIATFLITEWPLVDSETLEVEHFTSFANAHCSVKRPEPTTYVATEPLQVFIKFHSEAGVCIEPFEHLVPSKDEEAKLCFDYGVSGLGAKVYGFFKTQDGTLGRVDEFLDARTLEPEDVENAVIRADIAKALATFHSTKFSLPKNGTGPYYRAVIDGLKKYHKSEKLKKLGNEGGVRIDNLIDYGFEARLAKIVETLKVSIGGKLGFCIHDVQFMNVLVTNNPRQAESKVTLIDFEFVMQNYRAFDIGGHFMQKMFKWFDEENKIANCRKYNDDEKRHFCEEYAKQWNLVTGDSDTGEQVFLESEYGYMLAIPFDIHNMLFFIDETGENGALDLLGLNKLFEEFRDQYIKLGLE